MEHILKSRYKVGEKISENPFSVTYRGNFIGTEKPVVIKIYKRGTLNSGLIREMKQKVREFALFGHHGIAKLLDGDYGWQGFYYVREYIEGQSLQELFAKGEKIGIEKGSDIADQVLAVLAEAHERKIVHGALKPANIFIDSQGLVRVTDFVIEGEIKESLQQKVAEVMANARYASPEELAGRPATQASDTYSLGMILFEMAAGKPFPVHDGLAGNIRKLKGESLLGKNELAPLPRYLAEIILKALQPEPLFRFASAVNFRASLEQKNLIEPPRENEEYIRMFENLVTEYGGEDISQESEALEDVGRFQLRWGKEKQRNRLLAAVIAAAVVMGLLYAFLFGR